MLLNVLQRKYISICHQVGIQTCCTGLARWQMRSFSCLRVRNCLDSRLCCSKERCQIDESCLACRSTGTSHQSVKRRSHFCHPNGYSARLGLLGKTDRYTVHYNTRCFTTLCDQNQFSTHPSNSDVTCACRKLPVSDKLPIRSCSTQNGLGKNFLNRSALKPVQDKEIQNFLTKNSLNFAEGYTCLIGICPRHRSKLKVCQPHKLYINMTTGYFVCQSCKRTGNWEQIRDNLQCVMEKIAQKKLKSTPCFLELETDGVDYREKQKIHALWEGGRNLNIMREKDWEELVEELGIQKLSRQTLMTFGLKFPQESRGLMLPSFDSDGEVNGLKILNVQVFTQNAIERKRVFPRTIPRVDYNGLFGWGLIKPEDKEVVITASEFDAMAVYQETNIPALALPRGDSFLPQKILPLLEQFSRIILWFGGDVKRWESAKHFARKLNVQRCCLIRPSDVQPAPLIALQQGLSLRTILKSSRPVLHKSILTFGSLRHDVYTEFAEADQVAGVKWKRYPRLNELLKGHRRGELTVFTGPTGAGKTTFISDYSLDLCLQGVNTLWGSFEINNVKLLKMMMSQFSQKNLSKNLTEFDQWADKFEELPMYMMAFHGQENIQRVIETMSHAAYVHDISHVIVDNLQFMMGVSGNTAADRYLRQDQIISAFRNFATNMNCHVTLVIHPRKEREDDDLTVSSIFGSAKAGQEADNILILQDKRLSSPRGKKYIQVAKNRFDGELGVMLLSFNKESLSYATRTVKKSKEQAKDGDSHTSSVENISSVIPGQSD